MRATYQTPTRCRRQDRRIAWAVFGAAALAAEPFDPALDGRRHDWIGSPSQLGRPGLEVAKDHADEKRIVYKINTMIGLAEAAARRRGPRAAAVLRRHRGARAAQLSPPLPELEGELWLLTHPDLRNTARVRAFVDFCADDIARRRDVIEGSC